MEQVDFRNKFIEDETCIKQIIQACNQDVIKDYNLINLENFLIEPKYDSLVLIKGNFNGLNIALMINFLYNSEFNKYTLNSLKDIKNFIQQKKLYPTIYRLYSDSRSYTSLSKDVISKVLLILESNNYLLKDTKDISMVLFKTILNEE